MQLTTASTGSSSYLVAVDPEPPPAVDNLPFELVDTMR